MELRQLYRRPPTPAQLLSDSSPARLLLQFELQLQLQSRAYKLFKLSPRRTAWVCVCGLSAGAHCTGPGVEAGGLALLLAHWGRVQPSATWEARGIRGNRTAMWNGNTAALPPTTTPLPLPAFSLLLPLPPQCCPATGIGSQLVSVSSACAACCTDMYTDTHTYTHKPKHTQAHSQAHTNTDSEHKERRPSSRKYKTVFCLTNWTVYWKCLGNSCKNMRVAAAKRGRGG